MPDKTTGKYTFMNLTNYLKTASVALMCALSLTATAQSDSTDFRAYIINNEYEVFLNIDFYGESIEVPGQELYGRLPGYLGKKRNPFCWVITSAQVTGNTATISLINDYGSEDLTASLTRKNDSIYILKQLEGSALKVPKNGKWQKLPKVLELKRRK